MKQIVNISLGPDTDDYEFKGKFLDHNFYIRRFGTDGDLKKAETCYCNGIKRRMLSVWGMLNFPIQLDPAF